MHLLLRHCAIAALVTFCAGCATLGAAPTPVKPFSGGSVLIDNANVFDGERSIGTRDVLVEGGIIRRIAVKIAAPPGILIVDGRGRTLLPGLIDAHVHTIPGGPADALRFGVTSEFDLYSFGDAKAAAGRRRHRESLARTNEADVWSSGFGITPPGGHPSELFKGQEGVPPIPTLADGGDAKAFVKARVAEGADYIKVIEDDGARVGYHASLPAFSALRFAAVMRAAKDSRLKVIVHVQQLSFAKLAVANGADALAHALADAAADDQLLSAMRKRNVALIATLAIYDGIGGGGGAQRLLNDPDIAPYLSSIQKMLMAIALPHDPIEATTALETVTRAHRAGITILAGTDAPNPTTAFGASLQLELELLVKAGLTPKEALRAATSGPARFYGANDRGRIAHGFRADMILVERNPTIDIHDARRIVLVLKNGWPVERKLSTN